MSTEFDVKCGVRSAILGAAVTETLLLPRLIVPVSQYAHSDKQTDEAQPMDMALLFQLSIFLTLPFWLLMILLPMWRWTQRIIGSLWIAVPAALLYAILALPRLGGLLPLLANPSLASIATLLSTPAGATLAWVHMLAFDLFIGRWIYLDSRENRISPWPMAIVLACVLLVGPLGFLLYLAVRALAPKPCVQLA